MIRTIHHCANHQFSDLVKTRPLFDVAAWKGAHWSDCENRRNWKRGWDKRRDIVIVGALNACPHTAAENTRSAALTEATQCQGMYAVWTTRASFVAKITPHNVNIKVDLIRPQAHCTRCIMQMIRNSSLPDTKLCHWYIHFCTKFRYNRKIYILPDFEW